MKKLLKDVILLTIIAAGASFAINSISPNGIPLKGMWYDNRHQIKLDIPPSYDSETDSLLTMQEAFMLWKNDAVFIDTREPDEYCEGHIAGALNLPFEEWDDWWQEIEPYLSPNTKIVCYCGGLDCELSLYAARELKVIGYPNSYIFFGGFYTWIEYDLPWEYDNEE